MNAEKFFEKHSIEEISQRTKISPISLRFIRNKEFDKIPKAKFFGFINIIEKEFNVDLSELKEEYNLSAPKKEETQEIKIEKKEKKNHLLLILAFLLLITGGFILYATLNTNKTPDYETNITSTTIHTPVNTEAKKQNDLNTSYAYKTNPAISVQENNLTSKTSKKSDIKTDKNIIINTAPQPSKTGNTKYPIDIIPNKMVWFRAINIDTNKTIEYLTSKEKILPKGNYYIKFGHGEVTINYGNQTITPNSKKIVRILFKDGNYTYMQKPNRFER